MRHHCLEIAGDEPAEAVAVAAIRSPDCKKTLKSGASGRTPPEGARAELINQQRPVVKRGGIEVGSVRPHERVRLCVESDLSEELRISKWTEQLAGQHWCEVDLLLRAVLERHSQGVGAETFERTNAV